MISRRLKSIASEVPLGAIVADIGTDHGYIPYKLIKEGISKKVIATDNSLGSLSKVISLVKTNNLEAYIETRLGNGLEVIRKNEVDTVIISGMGGILIADILDKGKSIITDDMTLILQPNNNQYVLRKWLLNNGFYFYKESLVKENNFLYEIIVVKKGNIDKKDDIYCEIGYILPESGDPLFLEFLETKIKMIEMNIKKITSIDSENSKKAMINYEKKLAKIKEVYNCIVK